jgi:O-antigen/teichoic acid export membrane protein
MKHNFLPQFIKGIISTGSGRLVNIISGFFVFLIIVRFIPKEQLAAFILIQLIAYFFMVLSDLFVSDTAVIKLIISTEGKDKIKVVNTALGFKLLFGVFLSIIILLAKPFILYFFQSRQLSQLFGYIPLYFLFFSFRPFFREVLKGFYRYREIGISEIIYGLLYLLFTVILLIIFKKGVIGLVYAGFLSLTAMVTYQYLGIPFKKRIDFNFVLFRKIFRIGFLFGLDQFFIFVYEKIDKFMIGAMLSPIGLVYYETASKIPKNSFQMYESFKNVFLPNMLNLFAQKKYREVTEVLNNSLRLITLAAIFAAFITLLFQEDIVRILFSQRYLASAPVLPLLMFVLSFRFVQSIFRMLLIVLGQSNKMLKLGIINAVTNITGNFIMIPLFGFIGAAYAGIFSYIITNLFSVRILKKSGIDFQVSQCIKPILVFVLSAFLFLIIKPETVMVKLLLLVVFVSLCLLLSIIRKKDIFYLFESIRSNG